MEVKEDNKHSFDVGLVHSFIHFSGRGIDFVYHSLNTQDLSPVTGQLKSPAHFESNSTILDKAKLEVLTMVFRLRHKL